MAFTYDIATDRGKVRFEIGDFVSGTGVTTSGDNFTNAEIDYFLDAEADHIMRAVAAASETLARQWSLVPDTTLGPHGESASQVATAWAERATKLREDYGFGNTTGSFGFAVGTVPSDPSVSTGEYSV